jgi:surface-anchored protein
MVCVVLAISRLTAAPMLVEAGHADIGVRYSDGALLMESRIGSPGNSFSPADVVIIVPPSSRENRRNSVAYDALGIAAGEAFYKLSQGSFESTLEASPFLGLSAEGVGSGILVGNRIRLALVDLEGPGHFSLWRETSTGPGFESRPGFAGIPIASRDGIDAGDFIDLPVGLHEHANWGFSAPGRYLVTFAAQGELIGGGIVAAQGAFRFDVDMPHVITDLNGDGVTDRGDLASFVGLYGSNGVSGGADLTGDGLVGIADLVVLRAELATSTHAARAVAVCEPGAMTTAFVAMFSFICKRRKKRLARSCN